VSPENASTSCLTKQLQKLASLNHSDDSRTAGFGIGLSVLESNTQDQQSELRDNAEVSQCHGSHKTDNLAPA